MAQHAWKWKGNEKLKLFMNTAETLQFAKRLVWLTCSAEVVAPCFDRLARSTPFFCRTLKVLECCANKRSENDLLEKFILSHIQELTSLEALNLFGVNDRVVEKLRDISSPHFQSLNLSDCKSLTDKGLESLKSLPFLKVLNLNDCTQITNVTLANLHCMKDSLQSLSLSRCDNITNDGLVCLKEFSALQSLTLDYCNEVSGSGLANLFASSVGRGGRDEMNHPSLQQENSSIVGGRTSSYCSTAIHKRQVEESQSLEGGVVVVGGGGNTQDESRLSSLKSVDASNSNLSSTSCLNSETSSQHHHQHSPRELPAPLPPAGSGLKSLLLSSCTKMDDEALAFIGKRLWNSLTTLSLAFCTNITSRGVAENFSKMVYLENLDCRYCDQIGGEDSLKTIGKNLTSLKALNLYKCSGVTDRGLVHLKSLSNLQYLNISKCSLVTDVGVYNLIHCEEGTKKKNQTQFNNNDNHHEGEDDDDDPPTEKPHNNAAAVGGVVSAITTVPPPLSPSIDPNHTSPLTSSLLILHVSDCKQLTDTSMNYFHSLPALRFLNIVYCEKISQLAKDALEKANPRLNISHSIIPPHMDAMMANMKSAAQSSGQNSFNSVFQQMGGGSGGRTMHAAAHSSSGNNNNNTAGNGRLLQQ